MLGKREKRVMLLLDIIEFVLSVVAIIIFTLIFRLETGAIRYLFLLGDCYVIYSFSKTISSLEEKVEKLVIKNSQHKVESKYTEKLSA